MASWKRDFGSGLIVLLPLVVTVVFLAWIYGYLARIPILPNVAGPIRVVLTLLTFVLLVFSVGYLMRTALGAVLERALDDLMNHLPGLRVIYNASKMAVETALSGTGELQKPVRLEVWNGLRMTAFKTGNRAPDGREILFLPTAPNITTGFVIEVEEDRYTEISDDVEDALTRLLSAGFGNNDDTGAAELFGSTGDRPGEVSISDIDDAAANLASDGGTSADATHDGEMNSDPGDATPDGGMVGESKAAPSGDTPDSGDRGDDCPATDPTENRTDG
jgi:uncharacterized membrane protein